MKPSVLNAKVKMSPKEKTRRHLISVLIVGPISTIVGTLRALRSTKKSVVVGVKKESAPARPVVNVDVMQ
jgi:hypothetical protein